jgi:hypothetical protein
MTKLTTEFAPIVNAMMQPTSTQRISMKEAYQRFQALKDTLSYNNFHARIDTKFIGYIMRVPETKEELESLLNFNMESVS